MFTLRIKTGQHVDESGKVHKAGDTINSHVDLRKIFKEKFELVRGPEPIKTGAAVPKATDTDEDGFAEVKPQAGKKKVGAV